jgi:hypothetical protein
LTLTPRSKPGPSAPPKHSSKSTDPPVTDHADRPARGVREANGAANAAPGCSGTLRCAESPGGWERSCPTTAPLTRPAPAALHAPAQPKEKPMLTAATHIAQTDTAKESSKSTNPLVTDRPDRPARGVREANGAADAAPGCPGTPRSAGSPGGWERPASRPKHPPQERAAMHTFSIPVQVVLRRHLVRRVASRRERRTRSRRRHDEGKL